MQCREDVVLTPGARSVLDCHHRRALGRLVADEMRRGPVARRNQLGRGDGHERQSQADERCHRKAGGNGQQGAREARVLRDDAERGRAQRSRALGRRPGSRTFRAPSPTPATSSGSRSSASRARGSGRSRRPPARARRAPRHDPRRGPRPGRRRPQLHWSRARRARGAHADGEGRPRRRPHRCPRTPSKRP